MGWDTVVERKVLVDLDNEHWAWGNQIRPTKKEEQHESRVV